jgi:tetratricopeptide (TPR) repeat protein
LPHLRNPNFTGRDELLKDLHDSLTSGKAAALTQALHGLGGVGKTQTAVEYIYRHAAEYDIVWWIRSEEAAKLASDYAALAEPLRLKERGEKDQSVIVQAVRRALAARKRWLIVFDNANEAKEIREFLPVGGAGHVLVTSRNPAFGGVARPLRVDKMSEDEAVRFLLKRSGVEESKSPTSFRREREKKDGAPDVVPAAELAKELGYLPLALEHAGAYIEEKGATIASYLKVFTSQQKALLAGAKPPEGYPATVLTTWKLSFDEVEKKSEPAAQLMNLCAFFAPDDIGREMLRSGAKFLPEPLATAVAQDLPWDDAVGALRKYSLIEAKDGAVSVHRLVQAVVRDRLRVRGRKKWAEAAVGAVGVALPFEVDDFRTWGTYARLLPHGVASEGHAEGLGVALEACATILNKVGLYMRGRADFSAARLALERAAKIGEAVYGRDHPEAAIFVNNLGNVLQDQGELVEARMCYERALKIDEAAYGPDHPKVAIRVNNLGGALRDQGDLAGARACYERALKIDEAAYGPDHAEVATIVNNLGSVLKRQGDLAGARACYERSLKIDEAAYGPDHPRVAIGVNNLGDVLQDQKDLAGARECYERALKIDEAAYGLDHPDVAIRLNNLGGVLQDQGDLVGARECYERALRIFERSLGRDHPKTKVVRENLEGLG